MNLYIFSIFYVFCLTKVFARSFTVDYENNTFLKDGKPFRYISGTLHYFQVPSEFWYDRMYKMKMAGLNAIQTYVEWNHHEPEPGLLVIFRAGPYIDAERDMGGLPYWLLREYPNMNLRTFDPNYIKYVDKWYNVLLPIIELFYTTMEIENEYGFFGCDGQYKYHLRNLVNKALKRNVVLFTTDVPLDNLLACGKVDEALSTVDFGSGVNVTHNFDVLRWTQTYGPLVNSEFYTGWMDHWGKPHSTVSTDAIVKTLIEILKANASVNIYPFHGGTNFGFTVGANLDSTFQSIITSYDFDAPLNEAGDPTSKYYAIRDAIGKFNPLPPGPLPQPSPKMKLPPIVMKRLCHYGIFISKNNNSVFSTYPLSFEDLSHPFGFVLYKATVTFQPTDPVVLTVKDIADRAYVFFVNKKLESIPVRVLKGEDIEILVENQGRVCFGAIRDRKGILQNVTLDRTNIYDSFLRLDGWHKGVAFLNNFNLGRYWPIMGPQVTLYAPKILFKKSPAVNHIIMFELQNSPCSDFGTCAIQFVDIHVINGTTPQ
ncbi:beta-galactosidase [Caerostris extrusa]|uniref:Beta-galactosidase n=1 Tax=Caerostris extrusa TaxID=172846 RepID=A0AAV4VTS1_CAEEX|nr:beta-galactosidase [Caerostris extrusa]